MSIDTARARAQSGDLMIRSIDIANFKCFERLKIDKVKRINVLVGDNGSGKTALMEAIFLALGAGSELVNRYRQQRGLEGGTLVGNSAEIEEAIFSDLFFDKQMKIPPRVTLDSTGIDSRTVTITHGITEKATKFFRKRNPNFSAPSESYLPFTFSWMDNRQEERFAVPQLTAQGMQWIGTGEMHANSLFYPANQPVNPIESASRFSRLNNAFSDNVVKKSIVSNFPIVSDISLGLVAGMGILHATVPSLSRKLPLPSVSGAITRIVSILLAIAATPDGIILVDEMENGIYYKHQTAVWREILSSVREYRCQLITSTHSLEWLRALIAAAGDDVSDINFWRFELGENGKPEILQFSGDEIRDGIEYGAEVRGGAG